MFFKSLFFVVNIAILIIIIYYLKKLETIECKCALNFKHHYIFYFSCISLLYALMNFAFSSLKIYKIFVLFIAIPLMVGSIINIIFTIQYVNDLKDKNCNCSESINREIMYIVAILRASVLVLTILILISLFLMYPTDVNYVLKNKKIWKQFLKNDRSNNSI